MLTQGIIQFGKSTAFIDGYSDKCIDGKECDTNGDTIYIINGKRVRESDFKEYRRFSPQFRQQLIMEDIFKSDDSLTGSSCSCSKCGTIAMDEAYWL